ncbi:transglycosylase SLT domain-containing protein [Pseudonocardia alni]|uniref:aggregation-promoting factor C-terminal-like domain-containing protein n=1 Tax=Pseudonocardia alni TaxID=33907 RepID=UPI0033167C5F
MATRFTGAEAAVSIVPSLKGFGAKVNAGVKGTRVSPLQVQVNLDKKSLAAAEAEARAASERIGKARDTETKANEGLRLSEARLAEARKSSSAGSSALIAAENRHAQAKRAAAAASNAVTRASADEEAAHNRVRAAQDRLTASTAKTRGIRGVLSQAFSGIDTKRIEDADRGLTRAAGSAARLGGTAYSAASALVAIGGAAPAILAVGSALVTAAGAAALVPAGIAGIGAAVATIKIGTSGISDAFKAITKSEDSAASSGAAGAKAAKAHGEQIASAKERVRDASERASETQVRGARSVRDAEASLTAANQRATDARLELNRALVEAVRNLRDLNLEQKSSALSVDEAQLAYEQAVARLQQMRSEGASALDMRDAELGIRRAGVSLEEAKNRYADVSKEAATANRAGVAGADNVVAAQRGVRDANLAVSQAETALSETRADAARDNAQAARAVRDAVGELAKAYADTGDSAVTATDKAAQALADLAPNARSFVTAVRGLKDEWDGLKRSVQDRLFAGFAGEVTALGGTYIPILRQGLTGVAAGLNASALGASSFLRSQAGIGAVGTTLTNTASASTALAGSARPLVSIFTTFASVGSTFLPGLASGFSEAATSADGFIQNAARTGELAGWISNGLEALRQLGGLLWNLGSIVSTIFSAANAAGGSTIQLLNEGAGALAAWLKSAEGQQLLTTIFSTIRDVITSLMPGVQAISGVLLGLFFQLAPILPQVGQAFSALAIAAAPVLDTLGQLVIAVLPPLASFITNNADLVVGLAIAFGTLGLGLKGFIAVASGLSAVDTAIKAIRNSTILSTIATWANNAAWLANPITWIVIGIVAAIGLLVAGVIYAWNNFEWFRNSVMAVWDFLKMVGGWIATAFIAVWDALGAAFSWLGGIFSSVWSGFLRPVLDAFLSVAKFVGQLIIALVIGPLVLAWQGLSAAFQWVYANVLAPMFRAFAAIGQWLYVNVLLPIWTAMKAAWNALIAAFKWVYDTILAPMFRAFAAIGQWLYNNILAPIFRAIGVAWDGLSRAFRWVYDNVIAPVFGFFARAADGFRSTFGRIVDGIKSIWNGIREAFKQPVIFVLDTVWNRGIGGLWNAAKSVFPLGNFPAANVDAIRRMATGGPVRGPGTGTSDSIPTLLSNGEHVLTAAEVAAFGGHGAVQAWRQSITRGEADPIRLPLAGGGAATWQRLWGLVKGQFPAARLTDGYSPRPGYHGKGQAVDVAGPRSMDMPYMLKINQWIGRNYGGSSELIHTQPGAYNIKNGRPHTYNAATQAGHVNHVHWAEGGLLDKAMGAASNVWDDIVSFVDSLTSALASPTQWIRDQVGRFFPGNGTLAGDLPLKATDWAINTATNWLTGKASEMDAQSAATGLGAQGVGPVADQVRAVAKRRGWDVGAQWANLSALISKESSWNPTAQNPTSTAYGLFQFLNGTWGTVGGRKTSNPGEQAEYGLRYIAQKYRDPIGAWAFHRRNNWYDSGGWLPPGATMALNGTGAPEAVLTGPQWRQVDSLIASAAAMTDRSGDTYNVYPSARLDEVQVARETSRIRQFNRRVGV